MPFVPRFRSTTGRLFANYRLLSCGLAVLIAAQGSLLAEKARTPVPPQDAAKYPYRDAHQNEGVTVAAEPGDTKQTRPNTRLDYFAHGFLPVRVIVTNNSSDPVSLDDARILFISGDNTASNAATEEDLQRRLFTLKSAKGSTIPLPSPLPSITIHHKPVDKKILADDEDFGFKTTTVAPHATVAGYLFYDIRDLDQPVLEHATLEVRKIRVASSNKALDSFEIPLGKTEGSSRAGAE